MDGPRDSPSGDPRVELTTSSAVGDVRTTTVRLLGPAPGAPVAPASLLDPRTGQVALELHRLVGQSSRELTFETYGSSASPIEGGYLLRGWWMQDAHDLVTDLGREWTAKPYDDSGPDFCFLTYDNLDVGAIAYTDGRGHWISPAGYEKYMVEDVLRLRSRPPTT